MRRRITATEIAEVKQLRAKKYTWAAIGKMFGRSRTSWQRHVFLRSANGKRIRGKTHGRHNKIAVIQLDPPVPSVEHIHTLVDPPSTFTRIIIEGNPQTSHWVSDDQLTRIREILNNA